VNIAFTKPQSDQRRHGPVRGRASRLAAALARIDARVAAAALAGVIAALGVLGALFLEDNSYGDACRCWSARGGLGEFNLDGEFTISAAVAALLLGAAGALAVVAAAVDRLAARRRALACLGVFLAFMALDEIAALHEKLEGRLGVDWQVLYAPVVLFGGVCFVFVLLGARRFERRRSAVLLCLGAVAWLLAQILEELQWDGDTLLHPWMIVPEETLELAGSALFVLGLLGVLDALTATRHPSAPRRGAAAVRGHS
jgi:hypothetical protein